MSRLMPCLRCGALTRNGSWCEQHEPPRRPSPTNVLGLKRAPRLRRQAKARDGHRCVRCGSTGSKENPLEVHHRVPVSVAGAAANRLELLETLCHRCHVAEHRARSSPG